MRLLCPAFIFMLLPFGVLAQKVGDKVIVESKSELRTTPTNDADFVGTIDPESEATVTARGPHGDFYRIEVEDMKGWIPIERIITPAQKLQKEKVRKMRRRLRQKGYTVVLVAQTFDRKPTDVIDIGLTLTNISESKTIKYATATWQLFNSVGDPVQQDVRSSTAETRFVGPLGPGEAGQSTSENVWRSSVGTCAELQKLVVEHIDGTSFTYVNDLQDISQLSDSVRLNGDCSYEGQQSRE